MISRLKKLNTPHGTWIDGKAGAPGCFHVTNQHAFTQAAGYLKHVLATESACAVYYRGQSKLYPTLYPSLYRQIPSQKVKQQRDAALKAYLSSVDSEKKVLRAVKTYAREPLLQHYGIRTTWIDLVDNSWVALWFACHEAVSSGDYGRYLHFEARKPDKPDLYCYVLMVSSPVTNHSHGLAGIHRGPETEVIDLRAAVPSHFVRPHSQHALCLRRWKGLDFQHTDYMQFVSGIIRVSLSDALAWLGKGDLATIHALFPPASYDYGYLELLQGAPPGNKHVGAIHNVGA